MTPLRTLLLAALLCPTASTQDTPFTLDRVLSAPRSLLPQLPRVAWVTDTPAFSIVVPDENGDTVRRVPVSGTQPEEVFDAEALHAAFELDGLSPNRLPPFSWLDANTIRVERPQGVFHWNLMKDRPKRVLGPRPKGAGAHAIAPGDARVAYILDHDIVIQEPDGKTAQVTWDGKDGDLVYGGAAHRAEFGITNGLWWDRSGRYLAFSREDMRPIAIYPYVEYGEQPAARKHGRYPMAGQPHSKVTIGVFDTQDASLRYLEHDPDADVYWTNVSFAPDASGVYVALVSRGQDRCELVRFDTATGKREATLFAESDPEWIEPETGPIFLPDDSGRFLWFSPRSGFKNLWLYAADGTLERQLTDAKFDLRSFGGFTADGSGCYATGSGDNPLQMHLWRIDIGSGELTQVTEGRGRHSCMISDHDHVLDVWRSAENPGEVHVRTADGKTRVIFKAQDPLAKVDVGTHEFFEAEASDGTKLHGYLLKPPGFDPNRKYPLIHYVYGGPHSQLVTDVPGCGANLWLRWMASQGYLVSCVDNRGTDNRGIEFSQAVHRKLGRLEVEDQVAGIDTLLRRGYVDQDRVGVHGWSYGGYMTLRLMTMAPDRFAAGVSGAPVTDWSRYETGYTERYMDTPQENPEGYHAASVLPFVGQLEGRLLLITPSDDHTVMPSHSVAFLQACIDAGELVDHMVYPMQQHGLRGAHRSHFYRLMTRHFDEHLGATPAAAKPSKD